MEPCVNQTKQQEDFLDKYASPAFHELAKQRSTGNHEAAEKLRRYVRHIEKKEPKAVADYLKTSNESTHLEKLRNSYVLMQRLSWISLLLCAVATFSVLGMMILNPVLLQQRLYQLLCGGSALIFAVLTWICSGIGSSKARRMLELDLLLRVKTQAVGEEDGEAEEHADEAEETAAENTTEEVIAAEEAQIAEEAELAEAAVEEAAEEPK